MGLERVRTLPLPKQGGTGWVSSLFASFPMVGSKASDERKDGF